MRRVVVGLSGGVDSAVAAWLLLREGYEVVGATLLLGQGETQVAAAREVADHLGIRLEVADLRASFHRAVLAPSWEAYASGKTPNPCAVCNAAVKFPGLREVAHRVGADLVATGHYARLLHEPLRLARARDRAKDQSYFLFALSQEDAVRTVFPLGELSKGQVRDLAQRFGLPGARPESQDMCVARGQRFPRFLATLFDAQPTPGPIVTPQGEVVGTHRGTHLFTVGQRRAVGVALGAPAWVARVDPASATVTVTLDPRHLMATGLEATQVRWWGEVPREPLRCLVQVRSAQAPVPATVEPTGSHEATVWFHSPVRAVTPGQAAVWYRDDVVAGGGWIRAALGPPRA